MSAKKLHISVRNSCSVQCGRMRAISLFAAVLVM